MSATFLGSEGYKMASATLQVGGARGSSLRIGSPASFRAATAELGVHAVTEVVATCVLLFSALQPYIVAQVDVLDVVV